jgi:hypothetical protein
MALDGFQGGKKWLILALFGIFWHVKRVLFRLRGTAGYSESGVR